MTQHERMLPNARGPLVARENLELFCLLLVCQQDAMQSNSS